MNKNEWNTLTEAAAIGNRDAIWDAHGIALEDSDENLPAIDRAAFQALHDLADTTKDLATAAAAIARDMERLQDSIVRGFAVNGLGELQGRGCRLDQLCALREERAAKVRMLTNLATQD